MTSDPPPMGALSWLRETDALTDTALENAVEEDLRCERIDTGLVRVANHSHDDPTEHTHVVNTSGPVVAACSCASFMYRNEVCKHMVAVAMEIERS